VAVGKDSFGGGGGKRTADMGVEPTAGKLDEDGDGGEASAVIRVDAKCVKAPAYYSFGLSMLLFTYEWRNVGFLGFVPSQLWEESQSNSIYIWFSLVVNTALTRVPVHAAGTMNE
jgi:hypothetical protein